MAECRSCQITVDWATLPDGKTIPIDRSSAGDPTGNLAVRRTDTGTLEVRYLKGGEEPEPGEKRGISHFATCPQAANWRERKARRD